MFNITQKMENQKRKCNFKEHKEIDAVLYCQECQINMCNKCSTYHKGLIENHHLINIDENKKDVFTGYCSELNHPNKLNYFCKNHNKLCCAACIAKINDKGDGQHKDCDVCIIENIQEEKKNKLKNNINSLEELSKGFEKTIEEIKELFKKINDDKDELKLKVQKIFTKIRNKLNEREDELLNNIDEQFNKVYCNENIIKESEKLPNKIKASLEIGKLIDKEWNKDKELNSLINDCINIENNINNILLINENIKKIKMYSQVNILFIEEIGINELLESINHFGSIINKDFNLIFRESPLDKNNKKKYTITGNNNNILTKIEGNEWIGILCENELLRPKEYKWKIKILKNVSDHIRVGIVPKDYDNNSSDKYCCGWCFYTYYASLYSGPPHNYDNRKSNLNSIKNEIIIVVNMDKGTMKFIIDNVDKGISFTDIPLDKPLVPVVFLYDKGDSVEVSKC